MLPAKPLKNTLAVRLTTAAIPLSILCSFAFLARIDDLRLNIPVLILITAIVTILLVVYLYLNETFLNKNRRLRSPVVIICIAVIIRLLFVFQPVQLSDDIFRYYIDGHQIISGHNPYAAAPNAIATSTPYVSTILAKVNHPELVTIYPPAAQLVFAAGALFKTLSGIRVLFVLFDIGTCVLIIILLKKNSIPISRSVLYAWHPLPVLEIASSGHVDSAALFFMCLGFLLISVGKKPKSMTNQKSCGIISGFFFSCAFLTKLFPIVFLPVAFILVEKRQRVYFVSGFCAGCGVLTALFFPQILNAADTLETYTRNWEFSGFVFRLLRQITHSGDVARLILSGCFTSACMFISIRFYVSKNEQQDTDNNAFANAAKCCYFVSLCYLLLTPTLHPWYALYMVLFLPFVPGPSGLTLSWAVFLGYYVLIPYTLLGVWEEMNHIPVLIFAAPVLAFVLKSLIPKSNGTAVNIKTTGFVKEQKRPQRCM